MRIFLLYSAILSAESSSEKIWELSNPSLIPLWKYGGEISPMAFSLLCFEKCEWYQSIPFLKLLSWLKKHTSFSFGTNTSRCNLNISNNVVVPDLEAPTTIKFGDFVINL